MDTFKRRAYVYDYEAPPLQEAAAAASSSSTGEPESEDTKSCIGRKEASTFTFFFFVARTPMAGRDSSSVRTPQKRAQRLLCATDARGHVVMCAVDTAASLLMACSNASIARRV
jgi:hypothetical protein